MIANLVSGSLAALICGTILLILMVIMAQATKEASEDAAIIQNRLDTFAPRPWVCFRCKELVYAEQNKLALCEACRSEYEQQFTEKMSA